jgi:hypothetical protein
MIGEFGRQVTRAVAPCAQAAAAGSGVLVRHASEAGRCSRRTSSQNPIRFTTIFDVRDD